MKNKLKKTTFREETMLVCNICHEEIEQCGTCLDDLCIQMGCKFDGYCDGDNHYCINCAKRD